MGGPSNWGRSGPEAAHASRTTASTVSQTSCRAPCAPPGKGARSNTAARRLLGLRGRPTARATP
eukprot:1170236-Lingulodinium_polyedra.AAC.1